MYYYVDVQTEQELYPHTLWIKIHKTQSYILFVPRRANWQSAVTGSLFLNWSKSLIPKVQGLSACKNQLKAQLGQQLVTGRLSQATPHYKEMILYTEFLNLHNFFAFN